MTFHDGLIIDATRGSIARFVNHSCEPNCRVEKWIVDGEPRMALFAGDDGIFTGDELTYDYNFEYVACINMTMNAC
jgi:SET domain-containing protein